MSKNQLFMLTLPEYKQELQQALELHFGDFSLTDKQMKHYWCMDWSIEEVVDYLENSFALLTY